MTTRLEVLEKRQKELHEELFAIKKEIKQIHLDAYPIKVGTVITTTRDNQEYLVVEIVNPEWNWVKAVPRKKDGAWSKSARQFYGLQLFTKAGKKKP
jgi:hypothetical protein